MNKNMFSLNVLPIIASNISEIKSPGLESKDQPDANHFTRMFEPSTPGRRTNLSDRRRKLEEGGHVFLTRQRRNTYKEQTKEIKMFDLADIPIPELSVIESQESKVNNQALRSPREKARRSLPIGMFNNGLVKKLQLQEQDQDDYIRNLSKLSDSYKFEVLSPDLDSRQAGSCPRRV